MARLPGNARQILCMLLLMLLLTVFATRMHSEPATANSIQEPKPSGNPSPQESVPPPAVEAKTHGPTPDSAEQLRQAEIEADTKKLYQLSIELRAEVARTYKESLSVTVLKKAEGVEKLAKSLRILMSKEAASKQ